MNEVNHNAHNVSWCKLRHIRVQVEQLIVNVLMMDVEGRASLFGIV
jgi:hypothetical protein